MNKNPSEKISIEDYSPEWALIFNQLKAIYKSNLGELIADIQHVGSTSVVGLAAKPILDIDLIIKDKNNFHLIVEKLGKLGYEYQGDWGITGREVFKRKSAQTPIDNSGREWMKHNLYVCVAGSVSLRNHLALRDFLLQNPDTAQAYAQLKKQLAATHAEERELYTAGKTEFIVSILERLGFAASELATISSENQPKG